MSNYDHRDNSDGGFYRGLFYGLVFGVGLVWFLGTKEGKKLKEELMEKGRNFFASNENIGEGTDEDDNLPPVPPSL